MLKKIKRPLSMLLTIILLTPVIIIASTLFMNQANIFDTPGFSTRLKTFLTTNVAEVKPGAVLPELQAPVFAASRTELFENCLAAVKELGWAVTEADSQAFVIKAVVMTSLLRFKDDVSIQITDNGEHRSLTAVSKSRVGKGDLAANSAHLQQLLLKLQSK